MMKLKIFHTYLLLLFAFTVVFNLSAQDSKLIIIGNGDSVPSEMNMEQLTSVLKGEKLRWNDGSKVNIALMKTNTPVGLNTCKKLYNMTGNEVNKYFLALVFQGKVKAPNFFNTVDELESYVARTPGAIGVLQQANDKLIKTIVVDGKTEI